MKNVPLFFALVTGIAAVLASPHLSADKSMSFGADEIQESEEPTKTNQKLQKWLAEANKLRSNGRLADASIRFYRILDAADSDNYSAVPEAKFELGRTLLEMELYESALTYFTEIAGEGKSHPYYRPTLGQLLTLLEVIPEDRALLKHLSAYAEAFPNNIGPEHRNLYAFRIGRYFFDQANPSEAIRLLGDIDADDSHYAEAQYIEAVSHVSNYDAQPAVEAFKELLEHLLDKKATGSLDKKQNRLLELARLGMARVFYSTGDYETSIKYFKRIPKHSQRWPRALLEMSWAYFQTNNFNRALGDLHTLNSPYFKGEHMPEAPILSSVIYFYNCRYERTRRELENFDYYYQPVKKNVKTVLERYQSPSEIHQFTKRVRNGEAKLDEDIEDLIEDALSDREVGQALQLIETIEEEQKQLQSMASSWKSSALGSRLLQEISLAKSFALNDVQKLAKQRLKRIVKDIENLEVDKQEILYEVARAEKGQIESDVRAGMNVEEQTQTYRVEATDEQFQWAFSGAYWRDELGKYRFVVQSECKR